MKSTSGNTLALAKVYDHCESGNPALTVVMIHGLAADASTFDGLVKYLEQSEKMRDVRIVTFNLLGVGKSPMGKHYDYQEEISALDTAIDALEIKTPLVIMGHSMGTLIATRYTYEYPQKVRQLVLLSPPVFTEDDLKSPEMKKGLDLFSKLVARQNEKLTKSPAFLLPMQNIVKNPQNYETLTKINLPTTLIYGDEDIFIGAQNIPKILKINPCLSAVKVPGRHNITPEKYNQILKTLEKIMKNFKKS